MNGHGKTSQATSTTGALVANYLCQEEALLATALPIVRALQAAFMRPGKLAQSPEADRQQEFFRVMEEMHVGRQRFREELARQLQIGLGGATLERALAVLTDADREECASGLERVRKLAQDLAAANYEISVHLRIHLGAYRRILRDLTNTSAGSGRYGPAGKTESLDYRPLFHIHG